jgi:hypothetical protein
LSVYIKENIFKLETLLKGYKYTYVGETNNYEVRTSLNNSIYFKNQDYGTFYTIYGCYCFKFSNNEGFTFKNHLGENTIHN